MAVTPARFDQSDVEALVQIHELLIRGLVIEGFEKKDHENINSRVPLSKIADILENNGIGDDAEDYLTEIYEEIIPDEYIVNNDGSAVWLSVE